MSKNLEILKGIDFEILMMIKILKKNKNSQMKFFFFVIWNSIKYTQ